MTSLRKAGVALLFTCSCATVNTRVEERTVARGELVSRETSRHPSSDLLRIEAFSCRDRIALSATVHRACRRSTRQRIAVDREIVREAPAVKYEAIAAALLAGGGSLLAWQTRYGCDDSDPPSCSGSEPLMWTGISTAYVGVGLGLVSVIDAFRARDSKERVQSIETSSMIEWCGEEPARGRGVIVTIPAAVPLAGRLDDTGALSLGLPGGMAAPTTVAISVDGTSAISTPVRQLCEPEQPKPLSPPPPPPTASIPLRMVRAVCRHKADALCVSCAEWMISRVP